MTANIENLKPFTSEQSRAKAVVNGRKGGIKSGEVRRAKRTFRELMEEYGGMPDPDDPSLTNDQAIMVNQYKLAKSTKMGSTKAAEFIRDTKGESPKAAELTLNADIESITIKFGNKKVVDGEEG